MTGLTSATKASMLAVALLATGFTVLQSQVRAHDAPHFSAGEPGNRKQPARVVQITMREADGKMVFAPDRLEIRRGEQVRFVLTNAGHLDHEFMLATRDENAKHAVLMQKYPEMEHDDPNGRRVKPQEKAEIIWRFTKRGEFEFACLIPGHYEAGMRGTIVVR